MSAVASPSSSQRASGSSFYTAMRVLPAGQRDAMYEIYSFCRRVDDIADSPGPREPRVAELEQWRADIEALYRGTTTARTAGLAQPVREFGIDKADFLAVIAGMEMDTAGDIRAPDAATLDLYCDRVASAVGRLSVRIFGMERDAGRALAHHLGRALQLTNILRDLDEDAAIGRLYLPQEALRAAGITSSDPSVVLQHPALGKACDAIVAQARGHFAAAEEIMAVAPRRTVRAPKIMGSVYHAILERLVARGWAPPRPPVRTPRARVLWAILRHAFI
jgi:phytoene synthase